MSADSRQGRSGETSEPMDRLDELLADRALEGLSPEEQRELDLLLSKSSDVDAEAFDRTAAAIDLALGEQRFEPMPARLRERVAASASLSSTQIRSAHHRAIAETARPAGARLSPIARSSFVLWSGWAAAAAAIVLMVYIVRVRLRPSESRNLLDVIEAESDKITVAWNGTNDPDGKNVHGEIVWSNKLQSGFMRFAGLPKNDPTQHQYQLWIFDKNQDDKYPIDGGVFDIASTTTDAIVPIRAKLNVVWPKMFAVTEEKPGGVVVSAREHLVALAQI
jgi:hypothetical protein